MILQYGTSPHPSSGYKWGNQSAELHLKLVTLYGACVWIPRASGKTMWDDLKSTSQFYWQYIHFKGAEYGSWSDIKRLLNNSSGLIKRTCIDTDAVQREGEGVHKVHGRAFRQLCRISISSETSYSRIKKAREVHVYTFFDVLICYTFLTSVARRRACDECALTASVHVVWVCARPINLLNMKSTICYPAETGSLFIDIFQLIIYLPKVWFAPPTHTHICSLDTHMDSWCMSYV